MSELSTVFWIFSSISLRIWFYVAVSYRKTSKFVKKKREIFLWKSWVFRIFRLWEALFWQNFFEFLVFVVNVGKISSSSSQSRRKNSKLHWYGLFLAGRSWQNLNAFSYCKYEQTWPDSISAKDQEKFFLSIFPVRCGRIESDVIDSFFLGCAKSRRCANQFAYTLLFYSLKREGF